MLSIRAWKVEATPSPYSAAHATLRKISEVPSAESLEACNASTGLSSRARPHERRPPQQHAGTDSSSLPLAPGPPPPCLYSAPPVPGPPPPRSYFPHAWPSSGWPNPRYQAGPEHRLEGKLRRKPPGWSNPRSQAAIMPLSPQAILFLSNSLVCTSKQELERGDTL